MGTHYYCISYTLCQIKTRRKPNSLMAPASPTLFIYTNCYPTTETLPPCPQEPPFLSLFLRQTHNISHKQAGTGGEAEISDTQQFPAQWAQWKHALKSAGFCVWGTRTQGWLEHSDVYTAKSNKSVSCQ